MGVIHVDDDGRFAEALDNAGSRLVVCDFFADWCGPCRFIAPIFEQLSNKYSDALFLKIDVDRCRMTAQLHQISAMPTFIVLLNRAELGRVRGADANSLEQLIASNITSANKEVKNNPNAATEEERKWLAQFVTYSEKVKQYEDEINQTLAKSLLPSEEIYLKSTVNGKVNKYELAKNLMNWFHDDFFKWFDKPICEKCNETCVFAERGSCTPDENGDGASGVEIYKCPKCSEKIRFSRYENVMKLLETRCGRCGEWANCFALFCRAVGLDTRLVVDNLDHVWVEIFDDELDRWVHLDSCENVIDTPLMYDKGWKKKYSYVFAFSVDHVRDVTWRYAYNHKLALKRRTKCRENVLRNFIKKLNSRLENGLTSKRKEFLVQIYMKELVEFLSAKNQLRDGSMSENQGRQSGSAAWRQARDEYKEKFLPYTIKPSEKELAAKCLIISYDCVHDYYLRPNDDSFGKIKGWKSMANEAKDIFRKVETDWKKSYLCRTIGSRKGQIAWKIDLSGTDPKKVELELGQLTTYSSGQIMATACCGDSCTMIPESGSAIIDEVKGAEVLEVHIELSGGDGECAWQHAQLFRTDHLAPTSNLIIKVTFN